MQMNRYLCLALLAACSWGISCSAAPPTYATPDEAVADDDFQKQGEYAGNGAGVQLIAMGKGKFQAARFPGGLPGGGWDGKDPERTDGDWDKVSPIIEGMAKVNRKSPTLGAEVPEHGIALFDGSEESLAAHWKEGAQKDSDNLLMQGVQTTDLFDDFTLHVEFRLPYMPESHGQQRGNSGCYLQGRYEVQMLDSFGYPPADNECGGIYQIAVPKVNMCFPPLSWQTYDIDFRGARVDSEGKVTAPARVTVKLNGVVIHDDLELPHATKGAIISTVDGTPGPIFLQDHKNPVRYRNIWIVHHPRETR